MKAFFDKLTGNNDDEQERSNSFSYDSPTLASQDEEWFEEDQVQDEELQVDVFQDEDNLYIKAFVPGVHPSQLDIDIARDAVAIRGTKELAETVEEENYFQQELMFGTFARTIMLPREIDIDAAEAKSKDGMLVLTLPKMDKDRKNKLRVRSN